MVPMNAIHMDRIAYHTLYSRGWQGVEVRYFRSSSNMVYVSW